MCARERDENFAIFPIRVLISVPLGDFHFFPVDYLKHNLSFWPLHTRAQCCETSCKCMKITYKMLHNLRHLDLEKIVQVQTALPT